MTADKQQIEIVELYSKPKKVYPKWIFGHFSRLRVLAVWLLLGLFYGLPWLSWNGQQAVLFDLSNRQFRLFGLTLWPQDLVYLAALLILAACTLFFFTTLAGRLWCGYACPQTVWTEVFLWMEQLFEGDRNKRIKLDAAPWTGRKLAIKTGKHLAWGIFSLFTGFVFIGYFTPMAELWAGLQAWELSAWQWFWFLFYSLATYGNAGFLREQICIYMCPYARFQSAMFDKDTLIISYDAERGEPRGSRRKEVSLASSDLGSCIDCYQCVQVCPTGIDIRDGLQSECIGCALCIDACNEVMDKMQYPRDLIRYTSEHAMQHQTTQVIRPRILVYGLVLAGLFAAFVASLYWRVPLELDVVRDRNSLYNERPDGLVDNVYRLKVTNKAQHTQDLQLVVTPAAFKLEQPVRLSLAAGSVQTLVVAVVADPAELSQARQDIEFHLESSLNAERQYSEPASFIGPSVGR